MTTSDITINGVLIVAGCGNNQENRLVLVPAGKRNSPTNSSRCTRLQPDLAAGGAGEAMARLRARHVAYDEARDAFAALERAVERGYVDIG
jgi:hypothetical protein